MPTASNRFRQSFKPIYNFLEENKIYNKELQDHFYKKMIWNRSTPFDRLVNLLHGTVKTQRFPNMYKLIPFFSNIQSLSTDKSIFTSINKLADSLSVPGSTPSERKKPWESLYLALKAHHGWGSKTSALFVKNVINVHRSRNKVLHFLDDQPLPPLSTSVSRNADQIYLPVDGVIISIFKDLSDDKMKYPKRINEFLHENFSSCEILRLDDLWFWGTMTRRKGTITYDNETYEPPIGIAVKYLEQGYLVPKASTYFKSLNEKVERFSELTHQHKGIFRLG